MSTTATKTIAPDTLDLLAQCSSQGNRVTLPPIRLERPAYLAVNKVLEGIGGKWDRTAAAHVFDDGVDAADVLEEVVLTGVYTNRKQQFQFFETPVDLAKRLRDMAEIYQGQRILEPSAGAGRILERLPLSCVLDYCELDPERREGLKHDFVGATCVGEDFLAYDPGPVYDGVVANPPFTRQQDIQHVAHMIEVTKPGGIVVSVMSASVTFRTDAVTRGFQEMLRRHVASIEPLPAGTFAESGTMVNAVVVKVTVQRSE